MMAPIWYDRRQVRLMLRVARYFNLESCPTSESFGLERDGRGFVWNPR